MASKTLGTPRAKPLLRGVTHQVACFITLAAGLWLIYLAPSIRSGVAAVVYSLSVTILFGVSALYHRLTWTPAKRRLMKRLDHSAIFLLIAGSYTPVVLLTFPADRWVDFLSFIWGGAACGIIQSIIWPGAPRIVVAGLCLALGWAAVFEWDVFKLGLSNSQIVLVALGGVFYSIGAAVYALRYPDPWPAVFGYHEVFHMLTIMATVCHFFVVYQLVLAS